MLKEKPPTQIGKIIENTLQNPEFPHAPIPGYRVNMPVHEQRKLFIELKQKWQGIIKTSRNGVLAVRKIEEMVEDFIGEKSPIKKDRLNRLKLLGTEAETAILCRTVHEQMLNMLAVFANFRGTSLEEYQDKDLEEKQKALVELTYREVSLLRKKGQTAPVTKLIQQKIIAEGGNSFIEAGLTEGEIIVLFNGEQPEKSQFTALSKALNISANQLEILSED